MIRSMKDKQQTAWDKFWRDKEGKLTLTQPPNLPLLIWLLTVPGELLFKHGWPHNLFALVGFGALFAWAYLEIRSGNSYFRRALGVVVMIMILVNRVRN